MSCAEQAVEFDIWLSRDHSRVRSRVFLTGSKASSSASIVELRAKRLLQTLASPLSRRCCPGCHPDRLSNKKGAKKGCVQSCMSVKLQLPVVLHAYKIFVQARKLHDAQAKLPSNLSYTSAVYERVRFQDQSSCRKLSLLDSASVL